MNTISIGNDTRPLDQADPEWITQGITRRRKDGLAVCVRIEIRTGEINIPFATPTCGGGGGGGGRPPNSGERQLIDLWNKHGLNEQDFNAGGVVAFVKQALRVV